jgi:putative ABC transport system permease protein
MNTQWRKVAGDFRQHRLQLFLVALILVLGTAGVVAALNARAILAREIEESYQAANGADIILWFDNVTPHLLELVRSRPNVAEVDARATGFSRITGKSGESFAMRISIRPDFKNQKVNLVHRDSGGWPASTDGIFIEQSGTALLGVREGEQLQLRTSAGPPVTVRLAGFVHDTAVAPSTQDRIVYGYVTPAVGASLGLKREMNQLLVKLTRRGDVGDVTEFADDLSDWLKRQALAPLRVDALSNTHPHAMLMTMMLRILEILALIAFICSATLAGCVISLWMRREVRQIGVMKTLGARSWQLARQYLVLVAPLVLLGAVIAFPVGMALSNWAVKYHQRMLNIDVANWGVPRSLWLKEIVFAVGVPLLAMALPIWRAARMSPRKAIQDPGIVAPRGPIRLTSRLISMPGNRRWSFALRNSFRRPWRLTLTLLALSAGGALFLTAHNNYESLMRVINGALANRGHDIEVQLEPASPAAALESIAGAVPGVEIAEAFRRSSVTVVTDNDRSVAVREGRRIQLTGYPAGTQLLRLPLREGRWPLPAETGAVVINRQVQAAIPGLGLDVEMTVKFRERTSRLRVVGVVEEIGSPVVYAAFPVFETVTNLGDASTILRVKARGDREDIVAGALEQALLDGRVKSGFVSTKSEFRASLEEHFAVVGSVMKMIALASALVGAITLIATVSLGVIERAREIGVIRAIGARPRSVIGIFLVEGGAVGLLSAVFAVAGGIYFSILLNGMAERQLLHVAVPLYLSRTGLGLFSSGLLLIIAGVWLAVSRILRMSVRDALAYE